MSDESIKTELLGLEKKYWQAMKDNDIETALSLTDDPCIVAGAQGVASMDPLTMTEMLQSGEWKLNDFTVSDVQVSQLNDDVAILAYKVKEDLTVDGKPVTLEAADASTWIRRDGNWKCALHTESIVGDPYGRDKKKT